MVLVHPGPKVWLVKYVVCHSSNILNYVQTLLCNVFLGQILQSLFTLHQAIYIRCDPERWVRCTAVMTRGGRDLRKDGREETKEELELIRSTELARTS